MQRLPARATGLAALVALVAAASPAFAHGPAGGATTGYVSTAEGLRPIVPGVLVRVLSGDDRLRLANYSQKVVVIKGYEGEPYLRFTPKGVYANVLSPATYLSRERDPAKATVPARADANAAPRWHKVGVGQSYEWHDHRIHWTKATEPAQVREEPDKVHLLFRWAVPGSADGKPFRITGYLGYVPPPGTTAANGGSSWVWVVIAAVASLAVLAVAVGARRVTRRAPTGS